MFELAQRVAHDGPLPAPPGGLRRQCQRFTQQVPRQGRQKTQQRAGLQKGRTRCVHHGHVAGANHLQQAWHAQRGVGAQLQRVQKFVIQPLEQTVDRLQALEGFEEQAVVAHHQVAAFYQRQAEVARQVGMFKIGFVVGAGRQQHHAAVGHRAGGLHAVDQRAVGGGQALHFHVTKSIREQQGNRQPVFQQITQT